MTAVQAFILGIIQGLTEFLPVSSSAHLVFAQYFLNINEPTLAFDIFIHFTTLFAIIIYFFKDLLKITKKEILLLIIGTIPAVFVGVFLKDLIESAFDSVRYVAFELMISGLINFWIYRKLKKSGERIELLENVSYKKAFFVGIGQAIAISPGISRSGTTVLTSLLNNISREQAFRFSFLLAIPAILGASVLESISILRDPSQVGDTSLSVYLIGGITAFIVGLLSLKLFEYVIKKAQMHYFGVYCIIVGLIMFTITAA